MKEEEEEEEEEEGRGGGGLVVEMVVRSVKLSWRVGWRVDVFCESCEPTLGVEDVKPEWRRGLSHSTHPLGRLCSGSSE